MYVCTYVRMYVCNYVCMYIDTYIHTAAMAAQQPRETEGPQKNTSSRGGAERRKLRQLAQTVVVSGGGGQGGRTNKHTHEHTYKHTNHHTHKHTHKRTHKHTVGCTVIPGETRWPGLAVWEGRVGGVRVTVRSGSVGLKWWGGLEDGVRCPGRTEKWCFC